MADRRKRYILTLGGVDHTVLLSDEGAKRYGALAKPVAEKKPEPKKVPEKKPEPKKVPEKKPAGKKTE